MTAKKYKILCLTDNDEGRDIEMCLPLTYFLEKFLDCEVEFRFLWNIYSIKKLRPDVVLIPNAIGHHLYSEVAALCSVNNIPCFALESEGNFVTDGSHYYWGYNSTEKFLQEWVCCWSERTAGYLKQLKSDQQDKVVVTGGIGFDRYKIYSFLDRASFLKKHNKTGYDKIVGYAGWAFGKVFSKRKEQFFGRIHHDVETRLKWVGKHRVIVRDILDETIKNNPDTLFIFKRHPKEFWEDEPVEMPNEMNELLHYDNVLYIVDSEALQNIINVCDVWMGFETTTCLEAWLLGKTTFLINTEPDFPRNEIHSGSPKVKSYSELQARIDEYYNTGKISTFDELKGVRDQLFKKSIGFQDGYNHVRTAYYFKRTLDSLEEGKQSSVSFVSNIKYLRLYLTYTLGRLLYNKRLFLFLPKFKKTVFVFERWYLPKLKSLKSEYYSHLDDYYETKVPDVNPKDPSWWAGIMKDKP